MFERFFGEPKSFHAFKADWNVECKDAEELQTIVDTLMSECVPGCGEQVIFALVLLNQAVNPAKTFLIALDMARYLRYFYDTSSNPQVRQAFLYLVKKKSFLVTHSRPTRTFEQFPVGPETSSANIHERLWFLKGVLHSSPVITAQELASLKALLARYQESRLLSTCPLSASVSEDLNGLVEELGRVVAALESFSELPTNSPLPRSSSFRTRFAASNPILPALEMRRSMSAPPQRKRASSTLRSTTPPLESISNMPDIQF